MRMRVSRLLVLVVVAGITSGLASSAGAASIDESRAVDVISQTDELAVIQDGDWTRWVYSDPLASATIRTYRGERTPDGSCLYEISDNKETAPRGQATLEREISHNLRSCVSITERGLVDLESITEEFVVTEAFPVDPKIDLAASGTKTVWLKVVYEDPPQIDVSSVKSQVTFSYNGSCVTSSSGHNGYWYYFAGTGWVLNSSGGQAAQNCSYAATDSWGQMSNDPFCPGSGNTTYTTYTHVIVYGEENGTQTNSYNTSKSGGCSSLLSRQVLSS